MKKLLVFLVTVYSLSALGQAPTKFFDWQDNGGFWRKAINCGNNNQPGGAGNTKGSKVTYGTDSHVRFPGTKSVEFWTNSNFEETCNQNYSSERAEISVYADYRNLGVREGSTVWFGWSERYDEIDESHTTTCFQFRSNCSPGSPQIKINMLPSRRLVVKRKTPGEVLDIVNIKEDVWYDFVVEINYGKEADSYIKVWYAEIGQDYGAPVVLAGPTLDRGDNCPHIRWGLYRHQSGDKKPSQIKPEDRVMIKHVGPASLYVGTDEGFSRVDPKRLGGGPIDPPEEIPIPTDTGTVDTILEAEVNFPGLTNYALDGIATQSSTYGNGVASLAIDGETDGTLPWTDAADISHTNDDFPAWLSIKLDTTRYIDKAVIHNRKDDFARRLEGGVLIADTNAVGSLTSEHVQVFDISRYVDSLRIEVNNFLHVSEIQLWGKDTIISAQPVCELIDTVIEKREFLYYTDSTYFVPDTSTFSFTVLGVYNEYPIHYNKEVTIRREVWAVETENVKICRD